MDYKKILEDGYNGTRHYLECPPESVLEYLGDHIFDFTTYQSDMAEMFAEKALEVCNVITDRTNFEYIKNEENLKWFLIMCNMPFFGNKIDWGTSVRGAFWSFEIELDTTGLFSDDEQLIDPIKFKQDEWESFIKAMTDFAQLNVQNDGGSNAIKEK